MRLEGVVEFKSNVIDINGEKIKFSAATDKIILSDPDDSSHFTILYTTDIHAQLHTHDEFFWENGKAVYKKRGGLAVLKTMINHYRKQNPANTLLIDGGDYFHGSAVASLTEGEALIPLLNDFNYDLILPGNHQHIDITHAAGAQRDFHFSWPRCWRSDVAQHQIIRAP